MYTAVSRRESDLPVRRERVPFRGVNRPLAALREPYGQPFSSGRYAATPAARMKMSKSQKRKNLRRLRRKKRIKETVNCCKHFLAFMFSNLGLSSLIIAYTVLGGAMFQSLEYQQENTTRQAVQKYFNDTVTNMTAEIEESVQLRCQSLVQQLGNASDGGKRFDSLCQRLEIKSLANPRLDAHLKEYNRRLVIFINIEGWNGRFDEEVNWSFSGALLYVVTVITTIGYGQVVPKTHKGYLLTMLYAFFGIPLVFLYLNNVGDYLADAFRLLYRDAFRPAWRRIFRRRTRERLSAIATRCRRLAFVPLAAAAAGVSRLFERLCRACTTEVVGPEDEEEDESEEVLVLDDSTNLQVAGATAHSPPPPPSPPPLALTQTASPLALAKARGAALPPFMSSNASIRVAYVMARVLPARPAPPVLDLTGIPYHSEPPRLANGTQGHRQADAADDAASPRPDGNLLAQVQTPISQRPIRDWTSEELQQVPLIGWSDIDCELMEAAAAAAAAAAEAAAARCEADVFRLENDNDEDEAADRPGRLRKSSSVPATLAAAAPAASPRLRSLGESSGYESGAMPLRGRRSEPAQIGSRRGPRTAPAASPEWLEFLRQRRDSNPMLRRCSYVSVHEPSSASTSTQAEEDDDDKDSMQGLSLRQVTVPLSLSVSVMILYIIFGALIFTIWEDKDYVKWSYFCFITLSTIGFGDIVPGTKVDSENPKEKLIATVFYVAIGLSVFAMCFKLMQEEVLQKVRRLGRRMVAIRDRLTNGRGSDSGSAGGSCAGGGRRLKFTRSLRGMNGLWERLRPRSSVSL